MLTTALAALLASWAPAVQAADYEAAAREAVETLARLVAADTSNPPGNEAKAVEVAAQMLTKAGIPFEVTEFAPGRRNLTARLTGSGKEPPLLLLAHTDVPGADAQAWTSPPHVLTRSGDYLVGRGVYDMLGMAAVELETILLLAREKTTLRRDVIMAWTGDEQNDGAGLQYLLEHHRDSVAAAFAINEGAGPVLAEDGSVKLVEVQLAEKVYQNFELTARGPGGHASVPLADNAIYRLAAALGRLSSHRFPARLLPVTRAYFAARAALEPPETAAAMRALSVSTGTPPADAVAALAKNPTLDANLRTTCVATLLQAGTRVNTLPESAKASVNCRILPDESAADVLRRLREVVADPAVGIDLAGPPRQAGPSPEDAPAPRAVAKAAAKAWPGVPVVPVMSRSATDSVFLRAAGIPCYGIHPLAVTEADARRAHGSDERVRVKSVREGLEFFHGLLLELVH